MDIQNGIDRKVMIRGMAAEIEEQKMRFSISLMAQKINISDEYYQTGWQKDVYTHTQTFTSASDQLALLINSDDKVNFKSKCLPIQKQLTKPRQDANELMGKFGVYMDVQCLTVSVGDLVDFDIIAEKCRREFLSRLEVLMPWKMDETILRELQGITSILYAINQCQDDTVKSFMCLNDYVSSTNTKFSLAFRRHREVRGFRSSGLGLLLLLLQRQYFYSQTVLFRQLSVSVQQDWSTLCTPNTQSAGKLVNQFEAMVLPYLSASADPNEPLIPKSDAFMEKRRALIQQIRTTIRRLQTEKSLTEDCDIAKEFLFEEVTSIGHRILELPSYFPIDMGVDIEKQKFTDLREKFASYFEKALTALPQLNAGKQLPEENTLQKFVKKLKETQKELGENAETWAITDPKENAQLLNQMLEILVKQIYIVANAKENRAFISDLVCGKYYKEILDQIKPDKRNLQQLIDAGKVPMPQAHKNGVKSIEEQIKKSVDVFQLNTIFSSQQFKANTEDGLNIAFAKKISAVISQNRNSQDTDHNVWSQREMPITNACIDFLNVKLRTFVEPLVDHLLKQAIYVPVLIRKLDFPLDDVVARQNFEMFRNDFLSDFEVKMKIAVTELVSRIDARVHNHSRPSEMNLMEYYSGLKELVLTTQTGAEQRLKQLKRNKENFNKRDEFHQELDQLATGAFAAFRKVRTNAI